MNSKPVIFLHIPKTAGTTLHTIVDRQYAAHQIYSIGTNAQASIEEFKKLSIEEREKIRLLRGHMAYGLHDYLPVTDDYFTLLRDPVDRVVSYYNFILRTPEHYLYDIIVSNKLTLFDLMKTDYPIMMNDAQVRLLSGVWADVGYGKVNKTILEKAKQNLQLHFIVVGLTEEFDKTLFLLKDKLNWTAELFYEKKNVTRKRAKQQLPRQTLDIIRQYNQWDDELYQFAKELFARRVKAEGQHFLLKVKLFQLQNKFQGRYQSVRRLSIRVALRSKLQQVIAMI